HPRRPLSGCSPRSSMTDAAPKQLAIKSLPPLNKNSTLPPRTGSGDGEFSMPRGRPKNTVAPKKTTGTIKRRLSPATIQRAEHHAYDRAADLAKSYAEHWEAEAMNE